jgi:hypothetical protein
MSDAPIEDDDWDEEEDPLPRSVLVFTSPELDRDEVAARAAADRILSVHRSLVHGYCDLEWMERALRSSEPVSTRAHEAGVRIRRAITGLGEALAGTSDARDALICRLTEGVG